MTLSALVLLFVVVVVAALVIYVIDSAVPVSPPVKTVARVVIGLAVLLYALQAFGLI